MTAPLTGQDVDYPVVELIIQHYGVDWLLEHIDVDAAETEIDIIGENHPHIDLREGVRLVLAAAFRTEDQ